MRFRSGMRVAGWLLVGVGIGIAGYYAFAYYEYRADAMGIAALRALRALPDSRVAGMPLTQEVINEHYRQVFIEHLLSATVGLVVLAIGALLVARTRETGWNDE